MIVCRICLAKNASKDAFQLQFEVDGKTNSYADVMLFCLNIEVSSDSKSSRLCTKCYKNIVAFYNFKLLALENDKHYQSISKQCEVFIENTEIKQETEYSGNEDDIDGEFVFEIKEELSNEAGIKQECETLNGNLESDDELLIVVKQQKEEGIKEESKENLNQNAPVRRKHRKKHDDTEERLKVCEECGKEVRQLKEHMERHKAKSERRDIKCKNCDKVFTTHAARYRHNKIKHLNIKPVCPICSKSVCYLKVHMQLMHSPDLLKHACLQCERKFISQSKLDQHMRIHTKDRPFACQVCPSTFRSKVTMLMHTRSVHEKEKSHLCQFCSKSFFKKYHLQLHIRTHTKERPYACDTCTLSFASSNALNVHRKRHAGLKTVPCKFCDMMFVCSSDLSAHSVTHTRVKRHACQFCEAKFYRSDHRLKHERTAHLNHINLDPTKQYLAGLKSK